MRMYNCLVIVIDYRLALHAIILMGGAAASETLIGGYFCTIGGCSTPQKQPRENTGHLTQVHCIPVADKVMQLSRLFG